jgi:hypothetical protein
MCVDGWLRGVIVPKATTRLSRRSKRFTRMTHRVGVPRYTHGFTLRRPTRFASAAVPAGVLAPRPIAGALADGATVELRAARATVRCGACASAAEATVAPPTSPRVKVAATTRFLNFMSVFLLL